MTAARSAVALGGNLGDSARIFEDALTQIDALTETQVEQVSALYRTPPWGGIEQPPYLNAVARISTQLAPRALLQALLAIERRAGRDRSNEARWGPRVLDLDILLYGGAVIDEPGLQIPHPRLHQRAFALVPLVEAWPDAIIAGYGPAMDALIQLRAADPDAVADVIAGRLG